jgi:propanol-preferring alcohol dehydrogenase
MKAMILTRVHDLTTENSPLQLVHLSDPEPIGSEILIRVTACGVCHTELDEIEGRTPPPVYPVIPGHQIVGHVAGFGPDSTRFAPGDRVGVAWIYSACGVCDVCRNGYENICPSFRATGRDAHGGYAEYMTIPENFAHPIPDIYSDTQAAPLLCAGAVGYRSLRLTGLQNGQSLGLTGFGASAHIVLKLVAFQYPKTRISVFARNPSEQAFARDLGAAWAGDTADTPPENLDAIIDTTPAWTPIVQALKHLKPGGRLVINAIRKETRDQDALLQLDYATHLWMEKEIKSVANVTRNDVGEFLDVAAGAGIFPDVETFSLEQANVALMELKNRKIRGAKVLVLP